MSVQDSRSPTLLQLFLIFLKIGSTAFGGNVALVAAVREQVCTRKRWLDDQALLDFLTLGNILPGPLAVNVVASCGYRMRGVAGALVSIFGILLPAFALICTLSALYFQYGKSPLIEVVFNGLLPAVAAVIAATVWTLFQKNVNGWMQYVLVILAAVALLFSKNFWTTIAVIVIAGSIGALMMRDGETKKNINSKSNLFSKGPLLFLTSLIVLGIAIYFLPVDWLWRKLSLTFSAMSVTLFGGGYVFVPAIQHVVVDDLSWVSKREFIDGIAMGQVTPGPIMISAAFVGWKVSGVWGALVSTLGIFLPPAALMLLATQFMDRLRGNAVVESIFRGVRPAVIGMIAASVIVVLKTGTLDWNSAFIFIAVLILSIWKNISQAILVPCAGIFALILHLLIH